MGFDFYSPSGRPKRKKPPKPPKPPLGRVIRTGCAYRCNNCGSSASKRGLLNLFDERLCDNKECLNSKSRYYKL